MARSQYLIELKSELELQLGEVSAEMLSACLNLVDYVSIAPLKKMHLTFVDLYKHVDQSISEDIFYNAVFYLTKKNINVLTQKFEAYNSAIDRYEAILESEDIKEILDSIASGEYVHPLNGNILTAEEFSKQVLTFFSPSQVFVSNLYAH
ncbi:hypothetical protein N0P26_002676 [Acinetobacter baumannii]|uniref:Uncharacterized protein n=1 Tax=Acinetobacter baumannii TaxID=470 RepID=A0A9P2LC52_ACIBA|nr:hypothetical protein [Acinetobacter baumannii]EKT7959510.1 hypothetical protein [Acinetobacter baumannii]EKT9126176.1 hypothetical protein [Acinetobacter baumannii]EKT9272235.1 hypothetical protein [Acinetobacter baumannii]EKT9313522.1 hypothetical protein [Acinetobacter baumannii]EKU0109999.1 hypothetical protein [Acinetobacter baumannii]